MNSFFDSFKLWKINVFLQKNLKSLKSLIRQAMDRFDSVLILKNVFIYWCYRINQNLFSLTFQIQFSKANHLLKSGIIVEFMNTPEGVGRGEGVDVALLRQGEEGLLSVGQVHHISRLWQGSCHLLCGLDPSKLNLKLIKIINWSKNIKSVKILD